MLAAAGRGGAPGSEPHPAGHSRLPTRAPLRPGRRLRPRSLPGPPPRRGGTPAGGARSRPGSRPRTPAARAWGAPGAPGPRARRSHEVSPARAARDPPPAPRLCPPPPAAARPGSGSGPGPGSGSGPGRGVEPAQAICTPRPPPGAASRGSPGQSPPGSLRVGVPGWGRAAKTPRVLHFVRGPPSWPRLPVRDVAISGALLSTPTPQSSAGAGGGCWGRFGGDPGTFRFDRSGFPC